jgi:hypothetical protein
MQTARLLALSCLMAAALGCGGRTPGATASGTVTIDGKTAPAGIRVDFQPVGPGGSMSSGFTDDRGRYEMWFNANLKGVMPGECVVRLSLPEGGGADGSAGLPEALRQVRIPEGMGERSQLTRTVKRGPNTIDIDIPASDAGRSPR